MRSRAGSLLALDVCPDGTEYIVCGESTYLETFAITSKESKAQYGMGTMQVRLAPPPRGSPVLQQYSSFPAAFRADVASTCFSSSRCLPARLDSRVNVALIRHAAQSHSRIRFVPTPLT